MLADLEGRRPTGQPEAELWFGDHPGGPAVVPDGRTLDAWLAAEGAVTGAPERLPYLLKLLAAASPLSIQVHPTKQQALEGFAREEAARVPRDAPHRVYSDDNHKPEVIVALSETFTALAGLRDLDDTRRLVASLGEPARGLAERLSHPDAATALRGTLEWLLRGEAGDDIVAIVGAARAAATRAETAEFAGEYALAGRLDDDYPADPGIVVALLMNLVTLHRGEALFVPAGVLHAYVEGLGVEVMAASDNVLRGGLTPKHVDVDELLRIVRPEAGPPPRLHPQPAGDGVERFETGLPDFALLRVTVPGGRAVDVEVDGVAIALTTAGGVALTGASSGTAATLTPGQAVLITPDERRVQAEGAGELFIALPGRA